MVVSGRQCPDGAARYTLCLSQRNGDPEQVTSDVTSGAVDEIYVEYIYPISLFDQSAALRNENNHIIVLNGPIFEKRTKISVHDEKKIMSYVAYSTFTLTISLFETASLKQPACSFRT